jgi:hypothetical protein
MRRVLVAVDVDQALIGCVDPLVSNDVHIDIHERENEMRHHGHEANSLLGGDALIAQILEYRLLSEPLAAGRNMRHYSPHLESHLSFWMLALKVARWRRRVLGFEASFAAQSYNRE